MAWTGNVYVRNNGVFTGPLVWTDDRDAGTKITSAHHDTHDQDIADGITACINKNGANSPTANINWGAFQITNLGAGATPTAAANVGQTITAASLDAGTNVLTLTRATGDVTVDLSALAVGGSTSDFARYSNGANPFQGGATFEGTLECLFSIAIQDVLTASGPKTWNINALTSSLFQVANLAGAEFNFSGSGSAAQLTINGDAVWTTATLPASTFADVLTAASNPTLTGSWIFTTSTVFGSNVTCRGQSFITDASNNGYRIKRVSASAPLTLGMEISGLGTSIGIDLAIGMDSGSNPQAYISGERLWNTDSLQSGLTAAPTGGQNGYLAVVESGADRGLWTKTAGSWVKLIAFP